MSDRGFTWNGQWIEPPGFYEGVAEGLLNPRGDTYIDYTTLPAKPKSKLPLFGLAALIAFGIILVLKGR